MVAASAAVFAAPVFEGSEKRLEVEFAAGEGSPAAGLRALSRADLDSLTAAAACCIVSARHNAAFDAYVLSESSLFVFPHKVVLKTCGTTKLLAAVAPLLQLAAGLGMEPARAKYSRASFLFPEQQPDIHGSFEAETATLNKQIAGMGGSRGAYVLGDALRGLQWHVFVANAAGAAAASLSARTALPAPPKPATYTLEVCMTGLCPVKAAQFVRGSGFVSSAAVTAASGIRALLPGADIDDYVFDPCGYSMNGMEGSAFSTIHITPEDGFSYASVELCGYDAAALDPAAVVAQTAAIFRPASLSVALSVDAAVPGCGWCDGLEPLAGYIPGGATSQKLPSGGRVAFYNLERDVALRSSGGASLLGDMSALAAQDSGAIAAELPHIAEGAAVAGEGSEVVPSCPPTPDVLDQLLTAYSSDSDSQASSEDGAPQAPRGSKRASVTDGAGLAAAVTEALGDAQGLEAVLRLHKATRLAMPAQPGAAAAADAVLDAHIADLVADRGLDDTFYVMDLGIVAQLHAAWTACMPRVQPFYAVKCNGDVGLLRVLAELGAGFDCASTAEVAAVMALGVPPERIVFANACKRPSDVKAAYARRVMLTTFDTESELIKIQRWAPDASLLLRIRADDPSARCQLGNKYGAEVEDVAPLLAAARRMGLRVSGVSFHVGSGASNPDAFKEAIASAAWVFKMGKTFGFDMDLLDIGGGFAGCTPSADGAADLRRVSVAVNAALNAHFPPRNGVRIIAEPGRYFAEAAATLVCRVFGHRVKRAVEMGSESGGGGGCFDYWITDGLYGSMNCLLYDHATLSARALRCPTLPPPPSGSQDTHASTVFGPTCDGLDVVLKDYTLPELRNDDWLIFPRMGAYTLCGASNFNGIHAMDVPTFYISSG